MKRHLNLFILLSLFMTACYDDASGPSNESGPFGFSTGQTYGGTEPVAGGDRYNEFEENPFIDVAKAPISTFSVDADGASYANVRRFIMQDNFLPPKAAIRTEELINYFNFDYPNPETSHPIGLSGEISECPWTAGNKLIRIGIKGKSIPKGELPSSNSVFLIDVSGSMSSPDKLELLKSGFNLFVDELADDDRVAIVTYAGNAGLVLPATPGKEKDKIKTAINSLGSGGSTAGAEGIITAYQIAQEQYIDGGNNRVILATDGDFNVGPASQEELVKLIEEKRDFGIFLTVIGVGRGNYNDGTLEQIANKGNGTFEYADNLQQLKKIFIYDFGNFYTVAKDVKVQVEFNASLVEKYRLIGYENRLLESEDFEDDKKDAGEIGSGQNITALYEIVPKNNPDFRLNPTFTIKFRYKYPDEDTSIPLDLEIFDNANSFQQSSDFMKFNAGVAAFSMILRDSKYKGTSTLNGVQQWVDATQLRDEHQFKAEFRDLIEKAKSLQ